MQIFLIGGFLRPLFVAGPSYMGGYVPVGSPHGPSLLGEPANYTSHAPRREFALCLAAPELGSKPARHQTSCPRARAPREEREVRFHQCVRNNPGHAP